LRFSTSPRASDAAILKLMPVDDGLPRLQFESQQAWEEWLEANHDSSGGVWLKIAKKGAPKPTPTYAEALEVALAYGWIDGQKGGLDHHYWLQRFTKRKRTSKWSQINRDKAIALIESGRMRPSGLEQVEMAKADGRWAAAYEPQSRATVPEDLQRELDRNPEAKAFFETLKGPNRYGILYRISDAKRPETRAKRIATFIEMLNERRTLF
jgi:uncharacterized protein YdeI (YjbR/CyaY-like superfamily)